jgi:hypothetical protein
MFSLSWRVLYVRIIISEFITRLIASQECVQHANFIKQHLLSGGGDNVAAH